MVARSPAAAAAPTTLAPLAEPTTADAPAPLSPHTPAQPAADRSSALAPPGYIRLSGPIEHDNIVNGDGLRAVLWTQGCFTRCPGCQNPETWDPAAGLLVEISEVKRRLARLKGQAGLTFCGGEPFLQPAACLELATWARSELGWNIWSFSGYTYEKIRERGGLAWEFLKSLDALIDGPFILAQRDLTLKFRGSRNQRLLHLRDGEIVQVE